ncbi:MAG: penicillin acylase family protein, partial [Acidisphaera sp.]|nr:penicillin acylase family protein [Acidisphaera sp.]
PSIWPPDPATSAEQLIAGPARSGSNSAAVAAVRSASGAAMIASDPHLAVRLPNVWLIAGLHAPGLHAVGLMLAGFPFVALGRNPWIAWGGTNLHAASSELFDLSGLPPDAFREREATVRVRWGRPRRLRLRETDLGPVVSDGGLLRNPAPLALRWVGHRPSDEIGAMLGVNRARDWEGFSRALAGFAVPGQTMVYAGIDGRVGRLTAAHLPRRDPADPADLVTHPAAAWPLDGLADTTGLPRDFDPSRGFVVSANERPPAAFPVGYFFSSGARAARLAQLIEAAGRVSAADLERLQRDVQQPRALPLRDFLLTRVPSPPNGWGAARRRAVAALAAWDGSYAAGSEGALVMEIVLARLARSLGLAPFQTMWSAPSRLAREIMAIPPHALVPLLGDALARAARGLRAHRSWGGMHRLVLAHHLALLPLLGRRFVYGSFPAEGSNETLHKTGHAITARRHSVSFGSCARHISDLADPDANRFVLLGGQDGWPGSANFLDQVPLWRAGAYIGVPLRPETARTRFPHLTMLQPAR